MFKNFYGFHLLEAYQHRKHHEKRNRPGRVFKKTGEAIVVVLVCRPRDAHTMEPAK